MLSKLAKSSEKILSKLSNEQENIHEVLDLVNDLGHEFEMISCREGDNPIEQNRADIACIVNYDRIMDGLK